MRTCQRENHVKRKYKFFNPKIHKRVEISCPLCYYKYKKLIPYALKRRCPLYLGKVKILIRYSMAECAANPQR